MVRVGAVVASAQKEDARAQTCQFGNDDINPRQSVRLPKLLVAPAVRQPVTASYSQAERGSLFPGAKPGIRLRQAPTGPPPTILHPPIGSLSVATPA